MKAPVLLFVENHDSFSWMIIDYLKQCHAEVWVLDNQTNLSTALEWLDQVDGVVLGPGPDRPEDAGLLLELLDHCIKRNRPVLGICLGMQAIGLHFGASLSAGVSPLHGKASEILVTHNHPIFNGLPTRHLVGRYHSLVLSDIKPPLETIAVTSENQIVMAIAHRDLPIVGIQFHPESVLSPYGLPLLTNWVQFL